MAQNQPAGQEHKVVVELESSETGGRWWSGPMTDAEAEEYIIDAAEHGNFLSDYSCATGCAECTAP